MHQESNFFSPEGPLSGKDPDGYAEIQRLMGERLDDNRLMVSARSGDRRAFEILVSRYQQSLLRYASRTVGDSRADDVVQHVWIRAWQWIMDPSKELPQNTRAWLYRITHNQALNYIRDHQAPALEHSLDDVEVAYGQDVYRQAETKAQTRDMLRDLQGLPERQSRALLLHAAHGLSHEEIASRTGDNPQAVRGLIFRARAQMREKSSAWLGGLLPLPLLHKLSDRWHAGLTPTEKIAGAVGGAASTGMVSAMSGGSAVVAGSTGKIAMVLAAGAVATGGAVVVKEEASTQKPVIAQIAKVKSTKADSEPAQAAQGRSTTMNVHALIGKTAPPAPKPQAPTRPRSVHPVAPPAPDEPVIVGYDSPEDRPSAPQRERRSDSERPRWSAPGGSGGTDSAPRQGIYQAPEKQKPRWQNPVQEGERGNRQTMARRPGKFRGENHQAIQAPRWQNPPQRENSEQSEGWKKRSRGEKGKSRKWSPPAEDLENTD